MAFSIARRIEFPRSSHFEISCQWLVQTVVILSASFAVSPRQENLSVSSGHLDASFAMTDASKEQGKGEVTAQETATTCCKWLASHSAEVWRSVSRDETVTDLISDKISLFKFRHTKGSLQTIFMSSSWRGHPSSERHFSTENFNVLKISWGENEWRLQLVLENVWDKSSWKSCTELRQWNKHSIPSESNLLCEMSSCRRLLPWRDLEISSLFRWNSSAVKWQAESERKVSDGTFLKMIQRLSPLPFPRGLWLRVRVVKHDKGGCFVFSLLIAGLGW